MEVILKKNVDNLGYTNELVSVKNGYGRNFLIPQGYAILATASAKKAHAEIMKQKSHKDSKVRTEAEELGLNLEIFNAVDVLVDQLTGDDDNDDNLKKDDK